MLVNGEKSKTEIEAEFKGVCGWRTVQEAKSELGIEQYWDGDTSYWKLKG